MGDVELHLPADAAYVGLARLVVVAAARNAGMDDARIEDLRIAVGEAASNAVLAHQRSGQVDPVVVEFGPSEHGTFEVTVADAGPGESSDAPAPRDSVLGSELGVTLIRGLADDVTFTRREGAPVMTFAVGMEAPVDVDDGAWSVMSEPIQGSTPAW